VKKRQKRKRKLKRAQRKTKKKVRLGEGGSLNYTAKIRQWQPTRTRGEAKRGEDRADAKSPMVKKTTTSASSNRIRRGGEEGKKRDGSQRRGAFQEKQCRLGDFATKGGGGGVGGRMGRGG